MTGGDALVGDRGEVAPVALPDVALSFAGSRAPAGGEGVIGDHGNVAPVALPDAALSFAGSRSAAGGEGVVGDRSNLAPVALPDVALSFAGSRSVARSRIVCARTARVAQRIAGCGRAKARLVLAGMTGRAALIEDCGFATSGIAVMP